MTHIVYNNNIIEPGRELLYECNINDINVTSLDSECNTISGLNNEPSPGNIQIKSASLFPNEEVIPEINADSISGNHDSPNYPNSVSVDHYNPSDQPGTNEDGLIKLNKSFNIDITAVDSFQLTRFSNSLSVLNVNLRGLNTNFALFTAFLSQLKMCIKVIIITETHTDNDTVKLFNLNGYRKAAICRTKWGEVSFATFIIHLNSTLITNIRL